MATLQAEVERLEALKSSKQNFEMLIKRVEKAIEETEQRITAMKAIMVEEVPSSAPIENTIQEKKIPLEFDVFYDKYGSIFERAKEDAYSKKLYNFYKEAYVGNECEFKKLIKSWRGIYTRGQFSSRFGYYLREIFFASPAFVDDEYDTFLGLGYDRYLSQLRIRICRSRGTRYYYSQWARYFGLISSYEKRYVNNHDLELPKSKSNFKTFEGFDEALF